jgi:N-acetylmuramic acid 6-phosphate etherase
MDERKKEILAHLNRLDTETSNPTSKHIDRLPAVDICRIINSEDKTIASIVENEIDNIARAAEMAADVLRDGGRLFYIGAGTSGRLGVLDAAECPPTFGTDPGQVIGVIAGGRDTLVRSAEGIEDRAGEAAGDLQKLDFSSQDMLIGLAASIKTPYTVAGVRYAGDLGAKTALIVCNPAGDLDFRPDIVIQLQVGPEVITGSTRMKSGTAQKMALNMISTTAMVLLGKCYGNLMVDLKATSEKLVTRSRKILIDLLDISYDEADRLLESSGGSVKLAIAMHRLKIDRIEAEKRLAGADGFLWKLLDR